jgi:membrane associated rhomboid family serine protease/Zn-finger nucleic acid-binding protein
MAECPKCRTKLVEQPSKQGLLFICPGCNGRAMGIDALRKADIETTFLTSLWTRAHEPNTPHHRPCPHCGRPMAAVDARLTNRLIYLDICASCHSIWFDADEANKLPRKPAPKPEKQLSQKTQEVLLDAELETNRIIHAQKGDLPDSAFQNLLMVFGIYSLDNEDISERPPLLAWIITALMGLSSIVLLIILNRNIGTLGFLPSLWNSFGGLTIITSLIIHVQPLQLICNIIVLLAIADSLENAIGWKKFLALFVGSHLAGLFLYWLLLPNITTPYFGANSAIAGLLAFGAFISPETRYSFFSVVPGPKKYNPRWEKSSINSGGLLISYLFMQILTMSPLLVFYIRDLDPRHWLFMSFMTLGGIAVGLLAGLWHRAGENEKNRTVAVKPDPIKNIPK